MKVNIKHAWPILEKVNDFEVKIAGWEVQGECSGVPFDFNVKIESLKTSKVEIYKHIGPLLFDDV